VRRYDSELQVEGLHHSPGQGKDAGLGVGVWDLGCSVYTNGVNTEHRVQGLVGSGLQGMGEIL